MCGHTLCQYNRALVQCQIKTEDSHQLTRFNFMARKRERAHSTDDRMQMTMMKESNPTFFFFTDSSSSENIKKRKKCTITDKGIKCNTLLHRLFFLWMKISIIKNTYRFLMLPKWSINPDQQISVTNTYTNSTLFFKWQLQK